VRTWQPYEFVLTYIASWITEGVNRVSIEGLCEIKDNARRRAAGVNIMDKAAELSVTGESRNSTRGVMAGWVVAHL
jgi:hypothetical protein